MCPALIGRRCGDQCRADAAALLQSRPRRIGDLKLQGWQNLEALVGVPVHGFVFLGPLPPRTARRSARGLRSGRLERESRTGWLTLLRNARFGAMREKPMTRRSGFQIAAMSSSRRLLWSAVLCTVSGTATAEGKSGATHQQRISQSKPSAAPARAVKPPFAPRLVASIRQARTRLDSSRAALKLSQAQWTKAAQLEQRLDDSQKAALGRIAARLKAAAQRSARSKKSVSASELIEANQQDLRGLGERDVDAALGLMLRKAAEPETSQLLTVTEQAERNIAQRERLRESIRELRELIREWGDQEEQSVAWTDADGTLRRAVLTRTQVLAVLEELEARYDALSDSDDLMQLRLKDAMQKQQDAFRALSAILKALHEAAKTIIGNMKA